MQGLLLAAIMVPMFRSGYLLPAVTRFWAVLIHPEEGVSRSTTGGSDDSIVLDSVWLQWMSPTFVKFKRGRTTGPLWSFGYPTSLVRFRAAAEGFGAPHLVPYQLRHSGASNDRISEERDLLSIQKRGRWASHKSLVRYEKAARVGLSLMRYHAALRAHFDECMLHLEAIVLGRRPAIAVPTVPRG